MSAPIERPIQLRCIWSTLLRPEALELVQVVEQPVGVVGDLEVPLRELLLDDLGAAALAAAVDDLLVREHGLVVRAPVDRALLAVRETPLVQLLEQPLVPAVVLRVARVQHARPVEGRRRTRGSSRLLLLDVRVRPLARVGAALDRGVLGGQAERVPADRVQHVVAAVTPEARDDVDVRVVLGVTHVQVAGRVREHAEHVLARATCPRRRRRGTGRTPPTATATSAGWRTRRSHRRQRARRCRAGGSGTRDGTNRGVEVAARSATLQATGPPTSPSGGQRSLRSRRAARAP